jgi:hypothetical protein
MHTSMHTFNEGGLRRAFRKGSSRPNTIYYRAFHSEGAERLRQMLHPSPRDFGFGKPQPACGRWIGLSAQVSLEEGLTQEERVSGQSIRATLLARQLGVRWQRAKRWITSAEPDYERKKERKKASRAADRLEGAQAQRGLGVLGFEDELWWSRVALPSLLYPPCFTLLALPSSCTASAKKGGP